MAKPVEIDAETLKQIAEAAQGIPGGKIPLGHLPVPQKVLSLGKVLQLLDGLSLNDCTWVLETAQRVLNANKMTDYKRRERVRKLNWEVNNRKKTEQSPDKMGTVPRRRVMKDKTAGKNPFSNNGEHEFTPI